MSPTTPKGMPAKQGIPQTDREINAALRKYFSAGRRVQTLKARLEERLSRIRGQYAPKIQAEEEVEKGLFDAVQTSSEARRAEFTADGVKSKKFPNGTVGWRLGKWRLILKVPEEEVIAALKHRGLDRDYVVQKEVLNAQELIRDRVKLTGFEDLLSFTQQERFYIDPPNNKAA